MEEVTLPVAKCKTATLNLGANGTLTLAPATVDNATTDNCSFTTMVTPNTFTCANIGANTVVLKATDGAGNTATCSVVVVIIDQSVPTASCKNPTIYLNSVGQVTLTIADVDNGSGDACGLATRTLSRTEFNCSDITPVQTVIFTVTDQNGNSSSCASSVTIKDNIPPTAICANVSVTLRPNGKVAVFGADLASESFDNCSVYSYSPFAKVYSTANIGLNYLTITVSDFSGNSSTCVSEVEVLPYTPGTSDFTQGDDDQTDAPNGSMFDMAVYPNPTRVSVTVAFELPSDQAYQLRIFDVQGRMVMSRAETGYKGENYLPIQLESLAPGLYVVDLQAEGLKAVKRLLIQE